MSIAPPPDREPGSRALVAHGLYPRGSPRPSRGFGAISEYLSSCAGFESVPRPSRADLRAQQAGDCGRVDGVIRQFPTALPLMDVPGDASVEQRVGPALDAVEPRGHRARAAAAKRAASPRPAVPKEPAARSRQPAGSSGHRLLPGRGGRLPRRMLLAPMPGALDVAAFERRLLGGEVSAKRCQRPSRRRRTARVGMARDPGLGARGSGPGRTEDLRAGARRPRIAMNWDFQPWRQGAGRSESGAEWHYMRRQRMIRGGR